MKASIQTLTPGLAGASTIRTIRILITTLALWLCLTTSATVTVTWQFKNNASVAVYYNYWWWDGSQWVPGFSNGSGAINANSTTPIPAATINLTDGQLFRVTWGWSGGAGNQDILCHVTTSGLTQVAASEGLTVVFENVVLKLDSFYSNNSATEGSSTDFGVFWIDRTASSSTSYELPVLFFISGDATLSPTGSSSVGDYGLEEHYAPYPWISNSTKIHTNYTYIEIRIWAWHDTVNPEATESTTLSLIDTSPKTYGITSPTSYTAYIYNVP